jgi:hypothetical protein
MLETARNCARATLSVGLTVAVGGKVFTTAGVKETGVGETVLVGKMVGVTLTRVLVTEGTVVNVADGNAVEPLQPTKRKPSREKISKDFFMFSISQG